MAPLNPNNTARVKVTYQNAIAEHTFVVRVDDVSSVTALEGQLSIILADLSDLFDFSEVTGVQFAAEGSDLFFPHPPGLLGGFTWGSGPATQESNAVALTFVGRSLTGRRARFSIFGYAGAISDYRLTSAENADIASTVTALGASPTRFLAIDGNLPTWNGYGNIRAFDHWVEQART